MQLIQESLNCGDYFLNLLIWSKEVNFEESEKSQPDNNKWEVAKNESENENDVEQKIKQLR